MNPVQHIGTVDAEPGMTVGVSYFVDKEKIGLSVVASVPGINKSIIHFTLDPPATDYLAHLLRRAGDGKQGQDTVELSEDVKVSTTDDHRVALSVGHDSVFYFRTARHD